MDRRRARLRQLASRALALAFPGSRAVWLGALAVALLACVLGVRFLSANVAAYTGTNSVGVATVVGEVGNGQKACVRDLIVPDETGRIEVWLATLNAGPDARLDAWIATGGRRLPLTAQGIPTVHDFFPLEVKDTVSEDLVEASVCLAPHDMTLALGGAGVQRLPTAPVTTVAGQPLDDRDVSVRFLRPLGDSPPMIDALDDAIRRADVFEPGVGSILLWLALPALLVLVYVVVRVTATAESRTVRRLATTAAVVTFVHAVAWAVLMHPFHGADEPEHFAYAQYLAATNDLPDAREDSTRPPYSTSQLRLMEALHHNSTVLNKTSRPRWEQHWAEEYRALPEDPDDGDGGGYTVSGTGHGPLYYFVIGLPYRVAGDADDLPSILLVMRLFNALLACLIAALAVLTSDALLGGRFKPVAWLAGILAGLQPVFGSVAGAVNNDTAVNLAAAALLYLLVRAWARGPTTRSACLVGVVAIILPVSKITGFALLPVIAVAVVALIARYGLRTGARWGGIALASALAAAALWVFAIAPLIGTGQGAIRYKHPGVASPSGIAEPVGEPPRTRTVYAEYFVQTLLPWPTIGEDRWDLPGEGALETWPAYAIYLERGYGLFGWKSTALSSDTVRGVFYALLFGWLLVLVAAIRHRASWRRWLGGAAILVAAVLGVLALVSYAYTTAIIRTEPGEQGRYVFPALVALAVLFSTAVLAFRDRLRQAVLGASAAAVACLAVYAWAQALRGWFV